MTQDNEKIPDGFRILAASPDEWRVAYKSTGMGCMLWFLGICISGLAGGMAYFAIAQPADFRDMIFGSWWTPFAFAAGIGAIVYFTCFMIFHVFGEAVISVTSDDVAVSRRLFGLAWTKTIPRSHVSYLMQIKDGGEGDDSFPSWGLRLVGRRNCSLISRQPIEKSDWLGGRLAEILGVEFTPSEKRPERDASKAEGMNH
jgi:hypothetical protein